MKPLPSSPIRLRRGTRTLSKNRWPVSLECMPILRILFTVMPGTSLPFSRSRTMIRLLLRCLLPPSGSLVLASMHIQSACRLLVIHIFSPSMT